MPHASHEVHDPAAVLADHSDGTAALDVGDDHESEAPCVVPTKMKRFSSAEWVTLHDLLAVPGQPGAASHEVLEGLVAI
jgi:hypothetical protein